MAIGPAGVRGQLLHDLFIQVARATETEHVEWDAGLPRPLDDFADAMPAAGALIDTVRQNDDRFLSLGALGFERLDGFVRGIIKQRAALGPELTNLFFETGLVGRKALGRFDDVVEGK